MIYAVELQSNIVIAIHSYDNLQSVPQGFIVVGNADDIQLGQVFESV